MQRATALCRMFETWHRLCVRCDKVCTQVVPWNGSSGRPISASGKGSLNVLSHSQFAVANEDQKALEFESSNCKSQCFANS